MDGSQNLPVVLDGGLIDDSAVRLDTSPFNRQPKTVQAHGDDKI
jgi:hypothetical protein